MAETVKEFLKSHTSSKTSLRCHLLQDLHKSIQEKEVAEACVKPLVKASGNTLLLYNDRPSKFLVYQLLKTLCSVYPDSASGELASLLKNFQLMLRKTNQRLSRSAVTLLSWSLLALSSTPVAGSVFSSLVESQVIFVSSIASKYKPKAVKLLTEFWSKSEVNVSKSLDVVLESDAPNSLGLPLLSIMAAYCEGGTIWSERQVKVINYFSKAVLSSRIAPSPYLIESCSSSVFGQITHNQFSTHLLSPICKCILRNPDELVYAVACLLGCINLDLSRYAMEIIKVTSGLLRSSCESTRESAIALVENLSRRSSDTDVCVSVCQYLIDILSGKGSEGKIPIVEHRLAVIHAIGKVSCCPLTVTGKKQLADRALSGLITYLKTEAHSGSQVAVVSVMGLYCDCYRDSNAPSDETITHIKNALESKTTAPSLRVEYWYCVDMLCKDDHHVEVLKTFLPLVEQQVEKVKSSTQSYVLEEGVVALWIAVSRAMSLSDTVMSTISKIWPAMVSSGSLIDNEKIAFSSLKSSVQVTFIKVAECLLTSSIPDYTIPNPRVWISRIIEIIVASSWSTKQIGLNALKRATESVPEHSLLVIDKLYEYSQNNELYPEKTTKSLLWVLFSVCHSTFSEDIKKNIAVKSFLLCHYPELSSLWGGGKGTWQRLLHSLSLPFSSLVSCLSNLIDSLVSNTRAHSHVCGLGVRTLVKCAPEELGNAVTRRVMRVLQQDDILNITEEDLEIAATPSNELWNHQLRQLLSEGLLSKVEKNMKRETKAYSYEDQVWEAKLKEELAKKKLGERIDEDIKQRIDKAKLTQKQKQSIEDQLKYESNIRDKVHRITAELQASLTLFTSFINCSSQAVLLPSVPGVVLPILTGLESTMSTDYCQSMWLSLCSAVIPDTKLGLLLCWLTQRVLSPQISLPSYWSGLPLSSALSDLFSSIPITSDAHGDVVCYLCLPLLRGVLLDVNKYKDCIPNALTAINAMCKKHQSVEKYRHSLFPVVEMISLLSDGIASQEQSLKTVKSKKLMVEGFMALINTVSDLKELTTPFINEIVKMLSDQDSLLRQTGLRSMEILNESILQQQPALPNVMTALFVTCNDSISENSILASKLWDVAGYSESDSIFRDPLMSLLTSPKDEYLSLLSSTAVALGKWLNHHQQLAGSLRDELVEILHNLKKVPPPTTDEFGRTIATDYKDPWVGRVGVAKGFAELPKHMSASETMQLLEAIIPYGLSDSNNEVRMAMSEAAQQAITCHGETLSPQLMKHFDGCMNAFGNSQLDDLVRKDVVVLMGSLAKHMDKNDPKVKSVVQMLLSNLETPSQQVQQAISTCLIPLAPCIKQDAETIVPSLLNKLLESAVYSERRGAAYGLAGIVKGLGIPSLKQYEIMTRLQEAIKDKKSVRHREGALFAFEALCDILGKLFEPYVVTLLPDLLLCFGDGNQYVREATDQASKTIMAHLSSHGVKLILPSLLTALAQDNWRTKAGSAELLGTMAYCAPKQLSSCLPSIVPQLMEVLTDSHSKVQKAGNQALKEIGSVIKNPQVQQLVPELLDALGNPSSKTKPCLIALVSTEFEHRIDPPSLALIIPIIKRALDLRSAETKKMAAQVIANIYTVTDKKDLGPYLSEVLPGLKQSITDPLPEVRSACAKALGAMVQGVGEEELSKVLPWLLKTLQSESTPVDRSGAAQGISEVLKAQNIKHLKQLMPRFIDSAQNMNNPAHSRDGFLMLFIYLPQAFEEDFLPFIDHILPPILKGLADESEFIRDTSILAAQTIIGNYAEKSLDLFLPQLEKGLLDDNWRIRCSSVQLLGDLLFSISGQSGKMTTESAEDDNFASEELYQVIVRALGIERRNRVLAGLYMGRSDVALPVRQNSLHVWKLVVTNTARTLREILPTLISILLTCLACDSYDKRQVAAQTLGDLVRKLGERVLPEVIPMLEKGLRSELYQEREGVCIGLSEIIKETSKEYMQMYANSLLPTVRLALCDSSKGVRSAAAQTFDSLYVAVGHRVLEEVLTPLVDRLQSSVSEDEQMLVLDGLQQIMAVRSNVVLPMVIPHLIQPPVNMTALSLLSSVAGASLYKHLPRVIPAIAGSIMQNMGDSDILQMAVKVVLCVENEPGLSIMFEELFKLGRHESYRKRHASMLLIEAICSNGKSNIDLSEHIARLLVFVTESLTDENKDVCTTACCSLEALISKVITAKDLPNYIGDLHKALKTCQRHIEENRNGAVSEELHGFALMGIMPVLTMLKEGLVSGTQDNKEEGAKVLIVVISLSSAKTLTSGRVVMMIAGPLIRVLGDKYGWQVKVAVLEALVALVRKVGSGVKGFIPQLQSSYLKALIDQNQPVRAQAVTGIAELMKLSPRVDPVFNDIHNNIKKNEESSLRNSLLQALGGVLESAGNKMMNYKVDIKDTLIKLQDTAHEGNRLQAAKCLGILSTCLPDDQLMEVFEDNLTKITSTHDWGVLQAKALAILSAMQHNIERLSSMGLHDKIQSAITSFASSDRIPVCVTGLQCVSMFINKFDSVPQPIISTIKESFTHSSVDVRQSVCVCVRAIKDPSDPLLKEAVPLLLVAVQEKNTAVRSAAEEAILDLFTDPTTLKHCVSSVLDSGSGRRLEECFARLSSKRQVKA